MTFSKTHDTTITIDDEPVLVHVTRFTKAQAVDFERGFCKHGSTRGSAESTQQENDAREDAARQFIEESIAAYVFIDPGQIMDMGHDVTTGTDLIRTFCARADVLGVLYQSIYALNFLGKAQKKILSEQPFSSPGSDLSSRARNGEPPVPTAFSAESLNSAESAAAMASSSEMPGGELVSSGMATG